MTSLLQKTNKINGKDKNKDEKKKKEKFKKYSWEDLSSCDEQ